METTQTSRKRAPGAGRKRERPEGAEPWQVYCTPAERIAMQATLSRIRSGIPTLEYFAVLARGMDAAQAHRPAQGEVYLSLSDDGEWVPHGAPMAEEVQLRVPAIGPVELFDDRS